MPGRVLARLRHRSHVCLALHLLAYPSALYGFNIERLLVGVHGHGSPLQARPCCSLGAILRLPGGKALRALPPAQARASVPPALVLCFAWPRSFKRPPLAVGPLYPSFGLPFHTRSKQGARLRPSGTALALAGSSLHDVARTLHCSAPLWHGRAGLKLPRHCFAECVVLRTGFPCCVPGTWCALACAGLWGFFVFQAAQPRVKDKRMSIE